MGGTGIGVAIAGEDDAGVCPLCPAIFTASAESQTLTAYSTAPISHNQASDCFNWGLQTGVPTPSSNQNTLLSADYQQR
jgi:hypothetical protein